MTTPSARQRRERTERGTVLIEFSFVFALFAFICYALVAFGMVLNLKQNLTHAASEGARAALAAATCPDPSIDPVHNKTAYDACVAANEQAVAQAQTQAALAGQGSHAAHAVVQAPTLAPCSGSSGPQCITVSVTYDYKTYPLIPQAPGLGIVMPDRLSAQAVVRISNG